MPPETVMSVQPEETEGETKQEEVAPKRTRSGKVRRLSVSIREAIDTAGSQADKNTCRGKIWYILNDPTSSPAAWAIQVFLVSTRLSSSHVRDPGLTTSLEWLAQTIVILVSVLVLMLQTMPRFANQHDTFERIDTVIWVIFMTELVLRVAVALSPQSLLTDFYLYFDILSILPKFIDFFHLHLDPTPSYMQIFRGLRMIRLLKITRHYQGATILTKAFTTSLEALGIPFFFLSVAVTIAGSTLWGIESHADDREWSIPDAIFWYLHHSSTVDSPR